MKQALIVAALLGAFGLGQTAVAQTTADTGMPAVEASKLDAAKQAANLGVRPEQRDGAAKQTAPSQTQAKTATAPSKQAAQPKMKSPDGASGAPSAGSIINRANIVNALPGENVVIPIAINQPNRLITPFKAPQILSTDLTGGRGNDCGEACVRGNVVYISTDQTKPVTAFITEKGREDIAISVTMMPEHRAPRQVRFYLPESVMEQLRSGGDGTTTMGDNKEAMQWERSQPYVEMIRSSFRQVALGNVPQGFSMRKTKRNDDTPVCKQSGLVFDFKNGQVLEGHDMTIYVGTVENKANVPVEFIEMRCGSWDVAAVSSYPLKVLEPGEETEVYVAIKREQERPQGTIRKPLIERKFH